MSPTRSSRPTRGALIFFSLFPDTSLSQVLSSKRGRGATPGRNKRPGRSSDDGVASDLFDSLSSCSCHLRAFLPIAAALSALVMGSSPPYTAPDEGEGNKNPAYSVSFPSRRRANAFSLHRPPANFSASPQSRIGRVVILLTKRAAIDRSGGCPTPRPRDGMGAPVPANFHSEFWHGKLGETVGRTFCS